MCSYERQNQERMDKGEVCQAPSDTVFDIFLHNINI